MKKALIIWAIAVATAFSASPQSNGSDTKKSRLEGTWELVSGQQLPKGTRDIKIIAGGNCIFVAYDTETGKPRYTGGGTYTLSGNSYIEHINFMSDMISAGMIGKDQQFTVKVEGDTFTQTGVLSNGKSLVETWKRVK